MFKLRLVSRVSNVVTYKGSGLVVKVGKVGSQWVADVKNKGMLELPSKLIKLRPTSPKKWLLEDTNFYLEPAERDGFILLKSLSKC